MAITMGNGHRLFASEQYTNRFLWEVLPDGAWQDKPCFIIGGGPSFKDFDCELLRGYRTIGINRAYERFEPTVIFSMDLRFLMWVKTRRYGLPQMEAFMRARSYKVWLTTYICSLSHELFIIPAKGGYSQGHYEFTDSMLDGLGHGNNSGYGALNLAVCLGANPIYLLGFDMKHKEEQIGKSSHWHNGHPIPQDEETVQKFIHYFVRIAPQLEKQKVRVVNLNPDSAMDCFEKMNPEEVLH